MHLKKNNKGSSIVLVIVVLALVGIIAAVALWISLTNYQMKVTNKNVTDSFYSAEGVLDQIRAGLQGDVSTALTSAYETTMQSYASQNEEQRTQAFASSYISSIRSRLSNGGTDTLCDLNVLRSYVASDMSPDTVICSASGAADTCVLTTTTSGVVIKDLVVEYTDKGGYLSVIQTDIFLQIPSMNLVAAESAPNIFDFSLIGNAGVTIASANTTIEGSVYAGSQEALGTAQGTTSDEAYYKSLVIESGASCDFSGSGFVLVDGDMWMYGNGGTDYHVQFEPQQNLWARNINIDHANAGLYGYSYVSDDLILSGDSPAVTFSTASGGTTSKGTYIGYGTGTTAANDSSAIVLNGTKSTLDLSGVDTMIVAGYSYIGTSRLNSSKVGSTDFVTSDVPLGESIAVKGDQIAYLIPGECIGTLNPGTTSAVKQNPISVSDYQKIVGDSATYTLINENAVINATGKTLSDYLGGKSINDAYKMILVPSKTGKQGDGLVYFYLNLEPSQAEKWFEDYYGADSSKLKKYTDFYTNAVQAVGTDASIYTAGTYVTYDSGVLSYSVGTDAVNGSIGSLPLTYQALTSRLTTDSASVTAEQLGKTVFDNFIDETELTGFLSVCTGRKYVNSVDSGDGGTIYLLLEDGDVSAAEVRSCAGSSQSYCLIISTGNVTVPCNFTGTVIAKGTVTVQGDTNSTIKPMETEYVKKLLAMECTGGSGASAKTVSLYQLFKDGSVYMTSGLGSSASSTTAASSKVVLGDLITYQNWKKK